MILRDLGISVGDGARLPPEYTEQDFFRDVYHVREGFLVYLLRSFEGGHFLPEATKVDVCFGPGLNSSEYFCAFSVAQVYRSDFDFRQFVEATDDAREVMLLEQLSAGLRDVAQRQGVPATKVDLAEADARSSGGGLRYSIRSLGRFHPNRKFRFDVIREIERGSESWHLQVSDRSQRVLETLPIDLNTYGLVAASKYRKSKWRKDTFVLTDSRGRVRFQKSTKKLLARHID